MKSIFKWLLIKALKIALRIRYKINIQGLEEILSSKGTLFLSNLTTEIDPLLLFLVLYDNISVKILIPKDLCRRYWLWRLYSILGFGFLPPYAEEIGLGLKKKVLEAVEALSKGENLIIFPEGKMLLSPFDKISNSFTLSILKKDGEDITLVRIQGMWGSSFSHFLLGIEGPNNSLGSIFITILKNGIFLLPKRKVVIEFQRPAIEFKRDECNQFLETFFREPPLAKYGLRETKKGLYLVPYGFWQKEVKIKPLFLTNTEIKIDEVSESIKREVIAEIALLCKKKPGEISSTQNLYMDVGLNSLDVTELVIFLEEKYHRKVRFEHLRTVEDVILAAAGKVERFVVGREVHQNAQIWAEDKTIRNLGFATGKTIVEAFLQICDKHQSALACADFSYLMSYGRMKSLALGLALEFQKLEGQNIGVMIASGQMMNIIVIALMMAKKIPVLLNWTLGNRYLEEAIQKAHLQVILTMESSLKLIPYPLSPKIEGILHFYEEIRESTTFHEKKKTLALSRMKGLKLLKYLSYKEVKEEDTAIIIFTSGSEKSPKAVPLSHKNLLNNQKGAVSLLDFKNDDVLFGMLPSFHIFGFSLTNLMPLLYGMKAVFYSNPLDMNACLDLIQRWKITVLCTTPTLLKKLLSFEDKEKMKTIRLFIVGAEKASAELFHKVKEMGAQLIEGYGVTECSPIVTLNHLHEDHQGVGFPLPSVTIKVVDPLTKKELAIAEQGLILVHGPNVFSGYLGFDADPFIYLDSTKWYVTGDLGYINTRGALTITGRLMRSIKIGAEMISFAVMEEILQKELEKEFHHKDKPLKLAISARENETKLVLFCNYPVSLDRANALLHVAGLSNLFRLQEVRLIDPFPLLATGKVNFKDLDRL